MTGKGKSYRVLALTLAIAAVSGPARAQVIANLGAELLSWQAVFDTNFVPIAVTAPQRSPMLPDVPAVAEVVPGFASSFAFVMVAPAGTPPAIVSKLSAAISEAIKDPEVSRQLAEKGTQAVGSTPAEMAAFLAQEKQRYGGLVRSLNLKAD